MHALPGGEVHLVEREVSISVGTLMLEKSPPNNANQCLRTPHPPVSFTVWYQEYRLVTVQHGVHIIVLLLLFLLDNRRRYPP
jgi:hypothetical protein